MHAGVTVSDPSVCTVMLHTVCKVIVFAMTTKELLHSGVTVKLTAVDGLKLHRELQAGELEMRKVV